MRDLTDLTDAELAAEVQRLRATKDINWSLIVNDPSGEMGSIINASIRAVRAEQDHRAKAPLAICPVCQGAFRAVPRLSGPIVPFHPATTGESGECAGVGRPVDHWKRQTAMKVDVRTPAEHEAAADRELQKLLATASEVVKYTSAHTALSVSLAEALLGAVNRSPAPATINTSYGLGASQLPGLAKANEEAGELIQIIGKVLALGHLGMHWDGTILKDRLREEVADLIAALDVLVELNPELEDNVRVTRKRELFLQWHSEGIL